MTTVIEPRTQPSEIEYRAMGVIKAVSESGPIEFIASEESADRMGDVIEAAGWQLDGFKRNPVFLWSHNSHEPPIGKVSRIRVEGKQLLATVTFDTADPKAAEIEQKYRRGFLNAVSVGFRPLQFEQIKGGDSIAYRFKSQELLELSAVSVPAHPAALARAMEAAKREASMQRASDIDYGALRRGLADLKRDLRQTPRQSCQITASDLRRLLRAEKERLRPW